MTERTATGNTRLAQWGMTSFIGSFCFYCKFVLADNLVFQNPPQRQTWEPYAPLPNKNQKIETLRRLLIFLGSIILTGHLSSCTENFESSYATYDDLVKSGQLEHGWIPKTIPADSKDIDEIHNIDTNKTFGQFSFEKEINIDSLTSKINIDDIINKINSINRPARPTWFPTDKELKEMKAKVIKQDDFFIIFDNEKTKGYFVN